MFIKDGKRINVYAQHITEDGTRYPNLTDPYTRLALGVTEIPDPVAPEDYSDETYYRTEQDTAPYVVFTRKPDEQIARATQGKINQRALQYLASTDWYVVRFSETGTPVPDEIKVARQAARDSIVKVEEGINV